jgi:hypothetical protein
MAGWGTSLTSGRGTSALQEIKETKSKEMTKNLMQFMFNSV